MSQIIIGSKRTKKILKLILKAEMVKLEMSCSIGFISTIFLSFLSRRITDMRCLREGSVAFGDLCCPDTGGSFSYVTVSHPIESISMKSVYFKLYNFNFMQLSDIL